VIQQDIQMVSFIKPNIVLKLIQHKKTLEHGNQLEDH